jgi:hypothetical protein
MALGANIISLYVVVLKELKSYLKSLSLSSAIGYNITSVCFALLKANLLLVSFVVLKFLLLAKSSCQRSAI